MVSDLCMRVCVGAEQCHHVFCTSVCAGVYVYKVTTETVECTRAWKEYQSRRSSVQARYEWQSSRRFLMFSATGLTSICTDMPISQLLGERSRGSTVLVRGGNKSAIRFQQSCAFHPSPRVGSDATHATYVCT